MKQRLIRITTVLTLVLLAQQIWAQVPAKTDPSVAGKTVQAPKPVAKPTAGKYQAPAKIIDTVKNTDPTLNGQYKFMLSRSKTINGYKFINPYRLTALWQSVTDSLKKERDELNTVKDKIQDQGKLIGELQTKTAESDTTVNSSVDEPAPITSADEISFLGITFNKGTYHTLVWSIILILAIALVIVIARSANNISEAKQKTQLYDDISAEFQSYKSKANEKERKLARELQDERNKLEDLRSRG